LKERKIYPKMQYLDNDKRHWSSNKPSKRTIWNFS
jgi:hypothetical protein